METPTPEIAEAYDLAEAQVAEALAFYHVHTEEIDQAIQAESALEQACG